MVGRPRSSKTREAILKATRDILGEVGYSGLTFDAVAARSRAGKATVYRWWPTKGALVLDAARDQISIGVVPDTGNTRADLEHAINQLVETFSQPLASVVIFAAITPFENDTKLARAFREEYVYPWRTSAAAALQRGLDRGDIADGADIGFLLDLVVGTVLQRALVMRKPDTRNLTRKLLVLILRSG